MLTSELFVDVRWMRIKIKWARGHRNKETQSAANAAARE